MSLKESLIEIHFVERNGTTVTTLIEKALENWKFCFRTHLFVVNKEVQSEHFCSSCRSWKLMKWLALHLVILHWTLHLFSHSFL
jgi:hypothetical protein